MITEKITFKNEMSERQHKQIKRFLEDAFGSLDIDSTLNLCSLSKAEAQEIIENGSVLKSQLQKLTVKLLKENAIIDKRFGKAIREFEITVPFNYNHYEQMEEFCKKNNHMPYFKHDVNHIDQNNCLQLGKTYKACILPILDTVTNEDCMIFLRKQNAVLLGEHGAFLVWSLKPEQFPKNEWTCSFTEEDSLENESDYYRLCNIHAKLDGNFEFNLGAYNDDWEEGNFILCFYDQVIKN
ncbi:MAG: hypothetical protein QG566_419 [Patescibacteria group bacterium]|jgi:hypothetical protein|nr:hypothetical protein [Patescibacteria group bacterium]